METKEIAPLYAGPHDFSAAHAETTVATSCVRSLHSPDFVAPPLNNRPHLTLGFGRHLIPLVLSLLAVTAVLAASQAGVNSARAHKTTIIVDGNGTGRVFDGVGAISSSSSRLLYDYPEPQRSQILDYLFKPDYGASLQILKVEIGSDSNSTASAEPCHMRTPQEQDCQRGIEWWLMKQAQLRNPEIKLYGLLWGAPGWLNGGLWSPDHVRFILSWLNCAKQNGFRIDYIGGANESYQPPPKASFFVALRKALATTFPEVRIVATDGHTPPHYWSAATEMKTDSDYRNAVDIVGEHDVCHWRTLYQHCDASRDALDSGKPLWNSEQSSQDAAAGAGPLARAMNRNYIDAKVTANINWPAIASFYGSTETGGTGLMLAETPWSGYFEVNKSIWVDAHMTHFVRPGWRYIDSACGYLENGASYVALRSPDTDDYSVVIETMDAAVPGAVRIMPSGGLTGRSLRWWSTDLASENSEDWFVDMGLRQPGEAITLRPGHMYTLSTTSRQQKGASRKARAGTQGWLPLPYREDFEHVDGTRLAKYFQDVAGAFEAGPCGGGRSGNCYKQVVTQAPFRWHDGGKAPATLFGDPGWWGDYQLGADVMFEGRSYIELLGRVEKYNPDLLSGYHFQVADTGAWKLYSQNAKGENTELASGTTSFAPSTWHRMVMQFQGKHVSVSVDGRPLANVVDDGHTTGQIGLAVSPWQPAQFDNLTVVRTREWPRFIPRSLMRATATSAQTRVYQHHIHTADRAIDDRVESSWTSQFDPPLPLPQAITVDLGRSYTIYGLTYQPPLDLRHKTTITEYIVSVSTDGKSFREVSRGSWNDDTATKTAAWSTGVATRFVRLQATAVSGDAAGAAEINVALDPLR